MERPMDRERLSRLVDRYAVLRQDAIAWLCANDSNGEYDDASADAQGWERLTVDDCFAMIREAIATGAVAGNDAKYRCALTSHTVEGWTPSGAVKGAKGY